VLAVALLAWMTIFAIMLERMFAPIRDIAREHPERVATDWAPGYFSVTIDGPAPDLLPDPMLLAPLVTIVGITVLLLAAAVVRRLHDSGRSGAWGFLPLLFLVTGFLATPVMFRDSLTAESAFDPLPWLLLHNMLYLASLGILVAMLASRGMPGPNHYGPEPAAD
jgi:uncharacterized membrane protein YhaH (DUF805 family)